jgi:hypothetical protein
VDSRSVHAARIENNEMWSLFCPNEAPGMAIAMEKSLNVFMKNMKKKENSASK